MNRVVYQNILSEICTAIRNVPDDGTIEKMMLKCLAEKMLLDTMSDEEMMNDSLRIMNDRNETLRRKRAMHEETIDPSRPLSSTKVLQMRQKSSRAQ